MSDTPEHGTRMTLLERLARSGAADQSAWSDFVAHYGPILYRWCARYGLQDADARDVTQLVLLKLAGQMKRFTYDPAQSFRAWLKVITNHALHDYAARQQRPGLGSGDSAVLDSLQAVEARDDLERRLEEEFDRELLEKAMLRVRLRVAPHTWDAFCMTALQGVPAAEAARRLEMSLGAVYQARSKITKWLEAERAKLEGPELGPAAPPGSDP